MLGAAGFDDIPIVARMKWVKAQGEGWLGYAATRLEGRLIDFEKASASSVEIEYVFPIEIAKNTVIQALEFSDVGLEQGVYIFVLEIDGFNSGIQRLWKRGLQ